MTKQTPFKQNGLTQYQARFWHEALEILRELGVKFESAMAGTVPFNHWYRGQIRQRTGQVYFMLGDCDVAYYSSDMGVLSIQDTPRKWGKPALDSLETF